MQLVKYLLKHFPVIHVPVSYTHLVVVEAAVEAYLELNALLLNECEQLLDLVDIIVDRLLACLLYTSRCV